MNMRSVRVAIVFGLLLNSALTWAQVVIGPTRECAIPRLDGDKVPFPLKSANTKFDLAEDETYLLNGFVVKKNGKTLFKIDFETQPWLATPYREQFPFIPVDSDDPSFLSIPASNLVQMAVVVRRTASTGSDREFKGSVFLDVILPPVALDSLRNR